MSNAHDGIDRLYATRGFDRLDQDQQQRAAKYYVQGYSATAAIRKAQTTLNAIGCHFHNEDDPEAEAIREAEAAEYRGDVLQDR